MKKPEGVSCRDCRWFWWWGGLCTAKSDALVAWGIDPMSPDSMEDCDQFEIKTHREDGSIRIRHTHDKLPLMETVKLVRKARNLEYDDLIKRIKEGL